MDWICKTGMYLLYTNCNEISHKYICTCIISMHIVTALILWCICNYKMHQVIICGATSCNTAVVISQVDPLQICMYLHSCCVL